MRTTIGIHTNPKLHNVTDYLAQYVYYVIGNYVFPCKFPK